ncbi:hypothetical protein MMC30_006964 [Trapelia coarctata]|nr:hypothetical protein [Trapelia coarctata]
MAVVGLFCTGTILSTVLQCRPIEALWDQGVPAICENQDAGTLATGTGNFLTDVVVLALPIPSVWRLKLPRMTRVALMSLFGIGFVVCIISVFRIIYISTGVQFFDITYSKVPTDIYSILELTLGIICACLPIMRPIISKALPTFHSRVSISLGDEPPPPPPTPKRSLSRGFKRLNDDGGFSLTEIAKSREPQGNVSDTTVRETAGVINVTREWDVERQ